MLKTVMALSVYLLAMHAMPNRNASACIVMAPLAEGALEGQTDVGNLSLQTVDLKHPFV